MDLYVLFTYKYKGWFSPTKVYQWKVIDALNDEVLIVSKRDYLEMSEMSEDIKAIAKVLTTTATKKTIPIQVE